MAIINQQANVIGRAEHHSLQGRDYLVVPLTMIVEGVLNGSNGPLYYPLAELKASAHLWNAIPITLGHPGVSARDPGVLNQLQLGSVFRTRVAENRLVAEGWFDVERTRQIAPSVLNDLTIGRPIELSTGLKLSSERANAGSTFNNKPYRAIARNYEPDHLAILTDEIGACSLRDGCGVLAANQSETVYEFDFSDIERTVNYLMENYLPRLENNQDVETPLMVPTMNFEQAKPCGCNRQGTTDNSDRQPSGYVSGPSPDGLEPPLVAPTINYAQLSRR